MGILEAALEEVVARLPDEEWAALTARVRPPVSPPGVDHLNSGPDRVSGCR